MNKDYDINIDDDMVVRLILTTEEGYTLNQYVFEKIKGSGTKIHTNKFAITDKNGKEVYNIFK